MPWTGLDFSPRDVGEQVLLTIDFAPNLAPGEALASATSAIALLSGTDMTPSNRLIGNPTITGTLVSQMVSFAGLTLTVAAPTNQYRLFIKATTSLSQTLDAYTQVACSDPTLV